MSHNIEASLELSVGTLFTATENAVQNQPMDNSTDAYKRRLRTVCLVLHSLLAFSQARDNAAESQNELLEKLLEPPQEKILPVEPDYLSDLARPKDEELLKQLGGVRGVASRVGTDAPKQETIAVQNQPMDTSTDAYKRRLRTVCLVLHSLSAFSQARDNAAESQNELLEKLLEPPQEKILLVEPDYLYDLTRPKDEELLNKQLGGVRGVVSRVGTDADKGIQGDDGEIGRRRQTYGSNCIRKQPPKILHALLETVRDPIIIVLLLCGILALSFGIKRHGKGGLSDGVSLLFAVFIVVVVTAVANLWPKREMFKLSEAADNFNISVRRNGKPQTISVSDAVVGDVVDLKTGDQVPADGLYIAGKSFRVDESNVRDMDSVEVNDSNPFLHSGTKVINGSARMLVTAVGKNTWGEKLRLKSCHSDQSTPLQKRLYELSKIIAIIGSTVAFIALVILLIRYFSGNLLDDSGKSHFVAGKTRGPKVFDDVIGILATPVAIASTAIPEGLLLAILIGIAFYTKRMTIQNARVINLAACEKIGPTTVICTDERCLTLNHLKVTEFFFGDKCITQYPCSDIPQNVRRVLSRVVFLTHTEASSLSPSDSLDSQIENAIQKWVQDAGFVHLDDEQASASDTIHLPEASNSDNSLPAYQKGEAEAILPLCSHYYGENGHIKDMVQDSRENLEKRIQKMKSKGLQCTAFAHKKVSEEPNDDYGKSDDKDGCFESKLKKECLIFIGLVGLKSRSQDKIRKAVEDCKKAAIDFKIVTRKDHLTVRATAIACGILEDNWDMTTSEVVDGQNFGTCADNERPEKFLQTRVLGRASTSDKLDLVKCLKRNGEVVAFTGDTTADSSVLKEADVGLSLGIQGTQQARVNSDVVLEVDNFYSLVRALTWGRTMYHKIQVYVQFQLTVSISSLLIDFVTAVSAREPPTFKIVTAISSGKVPYATFQVLWVKLIVGILAAVAITIVDPAEELRQLPKIKRDQPFITYTMWKNIIGQAAYPIIILLTIQFHGQSIFNLDSRAKDTMIFNIFVLWQLCVLLKTKGVLLKTIGVDKNIFEGIWRRKFFWGIIGLIILLQVLIVEPLHTFADTKPLTWMQWMACISAAVPAWPIGWLIEKVVCSTEAFHQHRD